MYEKDARVIEVVDGDTIDVEIDLWFGLVFKIRLRLEGVDTHETYGVSRDTDEYQKGQIEAEFVKQWVIDSQTGEPFPFTVRVTDRGKYGRYISELENDDGEVINGLLIETFDVKSNR